MSGSSSRPDCVGETPRTICRYTGKNTIAPNIAKPMAKPMALDTEKIRLRNSRSGRIGSAARGAMLQAGTCYLEIFQYSAPEPEVTKPLHPFDRGYTHFCVDITDIEADIAHLTACGMSFTGRDWVDMGHVKTIYGYDPEGNIIEVQQCAPANGMTLEELKPAG